jgi:integrase
LQRTGIASQLSHGMQTSLPRHSYDHRTQKGRAASDPTASICPIESAEEVAAFATASQAVDGAAHIVDLLGLDAGLRLGEATALRWEDCFFGRDANDPHRSLRVRASRSRGVHLGTTKSGREL